MSMWEGDDPYKHKPQIPIHFKTSNPKDAVGIKKAPMSCVSAPVLMELGLAMMEGALKYGRHNYRAVGVRSSVYYDAFMRHMMAWWEGEDIDPDSGLPHLAKAMACIAVIRDSEIRGNLNDDRPPRVKPGWQQKLNEHAAELMEKYPEPKKAYTQVDQSWADPVYEQQQLDYRAPWDNRDITWYEPRPQQGQDWKP